jgi:sterol desaturase/sphingolipid hydroxylase (fatty acid hydroxylase superfamily)
MGKAIAFATPVFFLLIALELLVARARGMTGAYRLNDAVNSLSLGVMSQVVGLFVRVFNYGVYALVFEHVALGTWPQEWWAWVLAIVFYDFCYYWNHRLGHESAVFWASHVVHHQSQRYNLSTALRQTSSGAFLSWIFYLPMAVAGVPPEMFAVAAIVDLLYQYWIHTEVIGKLGWFDRWFASPSNHRVHHAVNDRYIDRNYGGIFMAWDRLFGTFVEETERCVYGTRAPLNSWDPLWANLEVYADLARKSMRCEHWGDRVRVWLKPPGWQPAGADGTGWNRPHFDLSQVQAYDPPMPGPVRVFACVQITLAILGSMLLLWYAEALFGLPLVAGAVAVIAVLWLTGAVMQSRLRMSRAVAAELAIVGIVGIAIVATGASAATAPAASPVIVPVVIDDAGVQHAVEIARAGFLAQQSFDRMHVTVLLEDRDGRWRRGAVEGDRLAYPASSVKLGFLVGAVHWCHEQRRTPDCLDDFVRPMIVDSDNVAIGEVVDRISGAPNAPVAGNDAEAWIERRRYTERVLESAGLLGPQRLFTKTYPTNSGEEPAELERLAWQRLGRNAMTTDLAAATMLNVVTGTLEPQATGYMRSLLRRPAFSGHSSLGGGLPPGSLHENKIGSAFDTLQDVMYAELPRGQRLVIAAFTNGWDSNEPQPWDVAKLGDFTARLLHELELDGDAGRAPRYLEASNADADAVRWSWRVPRPGRYQLALWYDADPGNTHDARATVVARGRRDDIAALDLATWGRRWIKLGDVALARGKAELVLTSSTPGRLTAGRLRVVRWPDAQAD